MARKKANSKVHSKALQWVREFRIQNPTIYFKFRDRDSGANSLSNHIWFSGTDYAFASITGNKAKGSSSNKTQNIGIVFSTSDLMWIEIVMIKGMEMRVFMTISDRIFLTLLQYLILIKHFINFKEFKKT